MGERGLASRRRSRRRSAGTGRGSSEASSSAQSATRPRSFTYATAPGAIGSQNAKTR